MDRKQKISTQLRNIKEQISSSNSTKTTPHLIAVSKRASLEDIGFAYDFGQRDFGENRVEHLEERAVTLQKQGCRDIRWHFIGHLQSNKLKRLFSLSHLGLAFIHSVDRLKLLEKMYSLSHLLQSSVGFFLQVNTSGEKEKFGLMGEKDLMEVGNFIASRSESSLPLRFCGLMTMSKIRTHEFEREAKKCFQKLKQARHQLEYHFGLGHLKLSMGMSSDYRLALKEGSDYLRLGQAVFG